MNHLIPSLKIIRLSKNNIFFLTIATLYNTVAIGVMHMTQGAIFLSPISGLMRPLADSISGSLHLIGLVRIQELQHGDIIFVMKGVPWLLLVEVERITLLINCRCFNYEKINSDAVQFH